MTQSKAIRLSPFLKCSPSLVLMRSMRPASSLDKVVYWRGGSWARISGATSGEVERNSSLVFSSTVAASAAQAQQPAAQRASGKAQNSRLGSLRRDEE